MLYKFCDVQEPFPLHPGEELQDTSPDSKHGNNNLSLNGTGLIGCETAESCYL